MLPAEEQAAISRRQKEYEHNFRLRCVKKIYMLDDHMHSLFDCSHREKLYRKDEKRRCMLSSLALLLKCDICLIDLKVVY
jgi:hypothetical protein